MSPLDRRRFLSLLALQAAAWSLGCGRHEGSRPAAAFPPNPHAGRWLGDDFTAGHRLRDGGLPPLDGGVVEPGCDVLVVGAGISGLAAARELAGRGHRVVVLEQAAETGGNAKSARWGDVEYAIGAAYLTRPEAGGPIDRLYRELGVLDHAKVVAHGEVFRDHALAREFWTGAGQGEADAAATRRMAAEFHRIYEQEYPAIPWTPDTAGWPRRRFEAFDRRTFRDWLDEQRAPEAVRQFAEYYCWSSFGGSAGELSAYAGLNFLAAEFGEILALPGGNAAVARALHRSAEERGASVESGTFVARVAPAAGGVEVVAITGERVRRFRARAAILAIPRFVAARVVEDFPDDRRELVAAMKWRAYVVANVLLARRPDPEWYDAYRLGALDPREAGWTDLVVADFVADPRSERCVLTAYRALPFDDGRATLLAPDAYARCAEAVRRDLRPVLASVGLSERDIVDVNLARWGHPLVLAQPGQLASGDMERLSAPLGRIAFAHQDRFGVPAIENALLAAFAARDEALEAMGVPDRA